MTSQILPVVILFLSLYSKLSLITAAAYTTTSSSFTSSTAPSSPPAAEQSVSHDVQDHSFSHTALLGPILSHLGFSELSMAAPSLASDSSTTAWSGPSTLFAPSDSSLRACFSCSVPNLLREHIVPGLFTIDYLRKLSFGTKIETLSPGRCITVTSSSVSRPSNKNATSSPSSVVDQKVFIGGVEITHPDLFNNDLVVIHGIQGYIAPLSPFSCDFERLNTLSFPYHPPVDYRASQHTPPVQPAMMRLMMRDAMLRLRNNGFSVLSLALRVKYAELAALSNFTVFALDDVSIFSGSHSYISSIRFHIVPNQYLTISYMEKLPVGTTLPTLEREQSLVVTSAGEGGLSVTPLRINYVRVKVPDVIRNLKIVVHSVYLPFPRIHPNHGGGSYDGGVLGGGGYGSVGVNGEEHEVSAAASTVAEGACLAVADMEDGGCGGGGTATASMSPTPNVKATVEIYDHYGL